MTNDKNIYAGINAPTPAPAPERTKAVKLTAGVKLTPAAYDALNRYRFDKQAQAGRRITWGNLLLGMVQELRERGKKGEDNEHR